MLNIKFYNLLFLTLSVFIGVTFLSCSKKDFESVVPSYITINDVSLSTTYISEGSNSDNITDVWVFLDENLIGVYNLPAKIPILKEGSCNLKIYGGIKVNGVSATRSRYLFYNPYEKQITLIKGEEFKINPELTYSASTNFLWLEDFESASLSFVTNQSSDTTIEKTNTEVFEGNVSGAVLLSSSMDFFEIHSPEYSGIPRNGSPVYLELNFKTNEPILAGIFAGTEQLGVVFLGQSSEWKKIYIDLTDAVNSKPTAPGYKVFFGYQNTESKNLKFYIDNIKLVHF